MTTEQASAELVSEYIRVSGGRRVPVRSLVAALCCLYPHTRPEDVMGYVIEAAMRRRAQVCWEVGP